MNADAPVKEFFAERLSGEGSDALVDRVEAHFREHGFGPYSCVFGNSLRTAKQKVSRRKFGRGNPNPWPIEMPRRVAGEHLAQARALLQAEDTVIGRVIRLSKAR